MKHKDLISSIRKLSVDLSSIADALEESEQPAPAQALPASTAQETPISTVPSESKAEEKQPAKEDPKKTYSFEEVRGILAKVSHAGHREEVKRLVLSHGKKSISGYKDDPEILAKLVEEAEALTNGK